MTSDTRRSKVRTAHIVRSADGFLAALPLPETTAMNGNTPYGGAPGVVDAGQRSTDVELTQNQRQSLQRAVAGIVSQTRSYLPDSYTVGSELSYGSNGPTATVAVRPPAGHPVSAGFAPDLDDLETGLETDERDEVARGLAASAALQVMDAVGDGITPTAR